MFHYFFYPSSVDWLNKPVVLWLNGGPGCSSLEGAFHENGPFVFEDGTSNWKANPKPWTDFVSSGVAVTI
jgi:carboxypeptidase C (cathepsin A)